MTSIGVVIPVGPKLHHQAFLNELLQSVLRQSRRPDEICIVDDMAVDLRGRLDLDHLSHQYPGIRFRVVENPWLLGVGNSFNVGVARCDTDAVFMTGADDILLPECLEAAAATFERHMGKDAYYYAGIRYMDTGELQTLPCNAALVTRGFWRLTGGFPLEAAVGAPDCALISILLAHHPDWLIPIDDGRPLVDYRRHELSDTAGRGVWQGCILESRDILTKTWEPPAWGR
jgi:glycosyltransferase involved in cell wall biosynthesis